MGANFELLKLNIRFPSKNYFELCYNTGQGFSLNNSFKNIFNLNLDFWHLYVFLG